MPLLPPALAAAPIARAALAALAFSGWIVLLLLGVAAGGAVHLLLAVALVLFPWRAAARPGGGSGASPD